MKKLTKRILSVLLSIIMVVSAMTVGFVASAAMMTERLPDVSTGETKFVVPEQIYLYPDALSWKNTTHTPYQYFVNNSANGVAVKNESSSKTGKIYVMVPATSFSVSINAYSDDALTTSITGGYTTVGGVDLTNDGANFVTFNCTRDSLETIDFSSGESPDLEATDNGYYLLWKITYTDVNDNLEKLLTAVSYVYKPYTVPVAAGAESGTGYSNPNWSGHITWLSGIHSINEDKFDRNSSNTFNHNKDIFGAAQYYGSNAIAGFISEEKTAYSNSVQVSYADSNKKPKSDYNTWYSGDAEQYQNFGENRYLVFANNSGNSSTANFRIGYSNTNPSGGGYVGNKTDSDRYNVYNYTAAGYQDNSYYNCTWVSSRSYGELTVDTSRYTDLKNIPNVGIGLIITEHQGIDDKNLDDDGKWFIADNTNSAGLPGEDANRSTWENSGDGSKNYKKGVHLENYFRYGTAISNSDKGSYQKACHVRYDYRIAGQGMRGDDKADNNFEKHDAASRADLRYAGSWPHALSGTGTQTLYIHGLSGNQENTVSWYYPQSNTQIGLDVTKTDKSGLRSSVYDATKIFGRIGVYEDENGNICSRYFDINSDASRFKDFLDKYKAAVTSLTKIDSTDDFATLKSNLDTACLNLTTQYTFDDGVHATVGTKPVKDITIGKANELDVDLSASASHPTVTALPGYEFKNLWSTNKNATVDDAQTNEVTIGYNNTVYPIAQAREFSIPINAMSGVLPTVAGVSQSTISVKFDETPSPQGVCTREGYTFTGYFDQSTGGNKFFDENGNWANPKGQTVWNFVNDSRQPTNLRMPSQLYAQWEKRTDAEINYYDYDGTLLYTARNLTFDSKYTYDQVQNLGDTPSRGYEDDVHYVFNGNWYYDQACTNKVDFKNFTITTMVTNLYPGFTPEAHNTNGRIEKTKDATCFEPGESNRYCTCGKLMDTIPQPEQRKHDMQTLAEGVVTPPTCTTRGYTTRYCKYDDCDYHADPESFVVATGHHFRYKAGESTPVSAATCTGAAIWHCKCQDCNEWGDIAVGDSTGHNPDLANPHTKNPTCTETGSTYYDCLNTNNGVPCDAHVDSKGVVGYDTIPATGHNFQPTALNDVDKTHVVKGKEATCHTQGTYYMYCDQCQKYADDPSFNGIEDKNVFVGGDFNPDNHEGKTRTDGFKQSWCKGTGFSGKVFCYGCNTFKDLGHETPIDPNTHIHGYRRATFTPSTCVTKGRASDLVCVDCGWVKQQGGELPLDPSNHPVDKLIYNQNHRLSTCTEYGTTGETVCTACGKTARGGRQILPIGHHGGTHTFNAIEATCCKDGYTGDQFCNACRDEGRGEVKIRDGEVIPASTIKHKDLDKNNICDICGARFSESDSQWSGVVTDEPTILPDGRECSCDCHKNLKGFKRFIFKLKMFFWKVFKIHKWCECGMEHYLGRT